MASVKKITMHEYNGTDYDTLYPKTIASQVDGVYNKTEVDTLLANKAPAGYGLGTTNVDGLQYDANNCTKNGWYMCKVNVPDNIWWYVLTVANYVDAVIVQKAWNFNYGKVLECMRLGWMEKPVDEGGGWQPWEYVNPPMALGVEYRTTERYNGKPVYVEAVGFGAMPNSTRKTLWSSPANNVDKIIDFGGEGGGNSFPTFDGVITMSPSKTSSNSIAFTIVTKSDFSSYNATVWAKFTKTTD